LSGIYTRFGRNSHQSFLCFVNKVCNFLKKILLVDTEGHLTSKIEAIVPASGSSLFIASDYNDGYRIAIRYHPDLILLCSDKCKKWSSYIKRICLDEVLSVIPIIVVAEEFSIEEQRAVMDIGADDYITEELLESSLSISINKRLSKISRIKQDVFTSINTFDESTGTNENDDHILVKIGNKLKLIEYSEIACITAMKEYSKIITKDNCKIIVRKSLKAWVKMLPAKTFIRIHRATIINIKYIEEITRTNERTYTVHLKNIKETFDFSYRYANIMRHTFPT
jgi:DNA-binding LytR/AlgR family response regulator